MKLKVLFVALLSLQMGLQAKPIKVMLLTGKTDNYHRWEVTSPYLKATLDHQKVFATDVVLLPPPGKAFDEFVPEFSKYQVVVLDINMPEWNEKAKTAFVNFVQKGGGVVVVHEDNNALQDCKEFN